LKGRSAVEHNLSEDEVKREVQKRKDAAISLGLPGVVEFLAENIRYYPNWKEKNPESCLSEVKNPRKRLIEKMECVAFIFNEHEYAVGINQQDLTLPDGEVWTSRYYFLYSGDGKLLFRISGFVEDDEGYVSMFKFRDITAYIPGEWTAELLKLHQLLQDHKATREAEQKAKSEAERLKALRKDFGL
jgi:hypothetical protein